MFATVLSLGVLLVGLVSMERLALREYPNVDQPVINIWTQYTGATAEVIESEVTTPMEEIMSGLEGIDFMSSVSRAGTSVVNITFKQDRDIEAAAADVRDRVARVMFRLPEDVINPVIWKQEADSNPFMWISITSGRYNGTELTELTEDQIKDRLQIIAGVGEVLVWAARDIAMRVWVDRTALAALELTVQDVEAAIRQQNVDIPAGQVESTNMELSILSKTSLQTPEQFANIVVAEKDGYLVRLRDVARVALGSADVRTNAKLNNVTTLALGIRLQSVANPLEVGTSIKRELEAMKDSLPQDVQLEVIVDSTRNIQASINNVYRTFAEAVVLVILVIFLFLRSPRATLIPAVTIPISLVGAATLMWWWGFSFNTLTLLAMVLAIGIVVDDAIVVLENIHRQIENGIAPREAAIRGSKEIFFAVVAMTITLAAVFAPLGFSEGTTGKLFVEFALTLAATVLISGFTAVTLTPMMCATLLHAEQAGQAGTGGVGERVSRRIEQGLLRLRAGYLDAVRRITERPRLAIVVLLISILLAAQLTMLLPRELAPNEDVGSIRVIGIAPEGTNLEYGERRTARLVKQILAIDGVEQVFASYGNPTINQHTFSVQLRDWANRARSQFDIHNDIKRLVALTPGLIFITLDVPPLGQSTSRRPVDLLLQSTMSFEELADVAGQVADKLRGNAALEGINLDLTLNKPQLEIDLDREKLADAGVDVANVGRTLETLFGGRDVTEFQRGVRKYDVIVQMESAERSEPSDILEIYLRGGRGQLILLEDVLSLEETIVPRQLNHFNKLRVANITANPAPGYTMGEALDSAVADISAMNLQGIELEFGGQSREYRQSGTQVYLLAVLSMLFIYLVLAAQFESFRDPLIILLSVPFAVLGAALFLGITGKSFSIYTQIGMITLVGLITKHGIMLVDTANRLRWEGVPKFEAIMTACSQRFRPILMTTAAMVLGSVPLAIATGAGAESRSQIGWVIVGGLLGGTLLTLLVTPSLYMLISRAKIQAVDG